MATLKYSAVNIILFLLLDNLWFKVVGKFFADQLRPIGRFAADGSWDLRIPEAVIVYIVMAVSLEVFVFKNSSLDSMKSIILHGAFLGFCLYAVFDFTNRAILSHYPLPFVAVDVFWGTTLFGLTAYIQFLLRKKFGLI